jgi:hypothetical protein
LVTETDVILLSCPASVRTHSPVAVDHTRTSIVMSKLVIRN